MADAPPKDPWAGTPSPTRAHDIETGKSLATAKAKQYVTEKYARVTSAMIRWQNEQTQILRKEDAEGGGFVATLLKITKIVETGIALAFPEIEAVKVITEVASFTTEVAATSNEISEDAAKKARAKASAAVLDQISGVVNDVLAKQTYFEIQADKTIKAALPKLDGDPKIADRLASNNDADIEYVVTKVLNVKDTQSAGNDIAHMLIQMDKEMAAYLKKAAVDEKMSRIGPLFKAGEMGDSMRKRLEDEYDDDHANDE